MSSEQNSSSSIDNNRKDEKTSNQWVSSQNSRSSESSPVYYTEESSGDRLTRKAKENPFFPIAITGFTCALLYGAYKFKYRGDMPISLYLIHLRVGAQGVAVGTLSIGMCYALGKRLYNNIFNIPNDTNSSLR